jgi:hypothetical protein
MTIVPSLTTTTFSQTSQQKPYVISRPPGLANLEIKQKWEIRLPRPPVTSRTSSSMPLGTSCNDAAIKLDARPMELNLLDINIVSKIS